jgi:hypothetical protein
MGVHDCAADGAVFADVLCSLGGAERGLGNGLGLRERDRNGETNEEG